MLISRRSRIWSGFLLAALLLSLLGTVITPSPTRAASDPPEHDEFATPLTVAVSLAELPSVGKSTEMTIVVSSTERASGVKVGLVGSEGLRIDGERELVIDLAGGESRTVQTRVTPEVAGNHTVAANVSLDFGDGTVWGDSDAVYFNSDKDAASEGFSYMGDPMSVAAVPGPGNTMKFESEAYPDGSMPELPIDEDVDVPAATGEPGRGDNGEGDIATAAGMLTIRGKTGMTDRDGTWKNQTLLVQLLSSSGSHIAFTYSDIKGDFVFNVSNPGTFRIRAWAYYRDGSMVNSAIRVVSNGTETSGPFSLAGWRYTSSVMGPFPDGETDVGVWQPDPNGSTRRAWWIYQDLVDGFLSTWNAVPPGVPAGSRQPDGVTVEWEPGSDVGAFYRPSSRRVKLRDFHADTSSVVLHEYGHAVMHNVYGNLPINDCPEEGHSIPEESGPVCAWIEGWADFFTIAVQHDPIFTGGCVQPCSPSLMDLEARNAITPIVQWHTGDRVEGNVAASLWDFVDAPVDGYDKTNSAITPFWKIWDVFYNQNHNTFRQFWDSWSADLTYSPFAQALATLHGNTIDYGWPAVCGDWGDETDDAHLGFLNVALPESPPDERYFCTDDDIDWYVLSAEAGEIYVFETSNLSTASNGTIADTTLTLYQLNSNNTLAQLAYDDNGGSETLASRIVYTAQADDDELLVAVRHRYGVGHPFYSYTFDVTHVTDNDAPTVTAPTHTLYAGSTLGNPTDGVYTVDVRADWTAEDPDDGIAFQSLQGQVDDAGFTMLEPSLAGDVRNHNVPVTIDATNQLQVSATDTYGVSSGYVTGESFELLGTQETDFTYEGTWTANDAAGAWDGSYMSTDGSASPSAAAVPGSEGGATATISFTGSSVALVGMTAPDGGFADIYIDGELHGRADFYAVKLMNRQVVFAVNDLSAGEHVLEVRWTNISNEGSSGHQLYLDGVIAID